MVSNRGRDTRPELAVRRLLHAAGLRYTVDVAPLPSLRRRADLVFSRRRVAVFIDGCFWHGCPQHYTVPQTNSEFWQTKVAANRARDEDTTARLVAADWTVVRAWEHEDPRVVAARVIAAVSVSGYPKRRASP
jgi:DNA mismatch endonuclease (patch repair protein)